MSLRSAGVAATTDVFEQPRTPLLGDLGMMIMPWPGDPEHPVPAAGRVSCFAIRGGQVAAIYDVVNPDKLSRVFGS